MAYESHYDTPDTYYSLSTRVEEIDDCIEEIHGIIQKWVEALDPRIRDYFHGSIENVTMPKDRLYYHQKGEATNVSTWLKSTTQDYEATLAKVQAIASGAGTGVDSITPGEQVTTPTTVDTTNLYLDPKAFIEWPADLRTYIIDKLISIGYTDQEINDITEGKYPIDKLTIETLEKIIIDVKDINPDIAKLLEETCGFSIFNEDGTIDINKLMLAELIAAKNIGVEIDLTTGSPFRLQIDKLSDEITKIANEHPEIRQLIIDKYGIDIFNEDGTIDINKLALIRVIDGQDLKDDYDITKLIEQYQQTTIKEPTQQQDTTPPTTVQITTPATTAVTTTAATTPEVQTRTTVTETTGPANTVTPTQSTTLGGVVGSTSNGAFTQNRRATDGLGASVTDGLGAAGKGIMDAVRMGANKIASRMSAYRVGSSAGAGTNKAAAGIIAAASLAVSGSAAGGVLLHKKGSTIKFTPKDWDALGEEYQHTIENLMDRVGFSEDEIETFKHSNFKIAKEEMKEHISKIEKALDFNPTCDDELLKIYDYSFLDDNGKVIDYLLFITMIIDGKNSIDDYNMYNVINQSFENVDEADFIYSGIAMEDYFDESSDDEQLSEEEEVKILNDPTTTDYDDDEDDEEEETEEEKDGLETETASIDKEWLQGIGIDD